jgi:hypothetical protein
MERFIVVAWFGGIPYMLQYRGVVEWFFYNNHIRMFKTKKTAIKAAYKVAARYMYDTIKVYSMTEGEMVDTDHIRKWEHKEAERIVFELEKVHANNKKREHLRVKYFSSRVKESE